MAKEKVSFISLHNAQDLFLPHGPELPSVSTVNLRGDILKFYYFWNLF